VHKSNSSTQTKMPRSKWCARSACSFASQRCSTCGPQPVRRKAQHRVHFIWICDLASVQRDAQSHLHSPHTTITAAPALDWAGLNLVRPSHAVFASMATAALRTVLAYARASRHSLSGRWRGRRKGRCPRRRGACTWQPGRPASLVQTWQSARLHCKVSTVPVCQLQATCRMYTVNGANL
jgi:hypothetical protein